MNLGREIPAPCLKPRAMRLLVIGPIFLVPYIYIEKNQVMGRHTQRNLKDFNPIIKNIAAGLESLRSDQGPQRESRSISKDS